MRIAAVDRDLEYLFANDAYLSFHGLDREKTLRNHVRVVLDENVFDAIEPCLERTFSGEINQFEMRCEHPEMGERKLTIQSAPIEDVTGEISGAPAWMQDVTDQVERERRKPS